MNATQITATFTIAANATTGGHTVTVTGTTGTSNGVTFTVNAAGPSLASIAPASGTRGRAVCGSTFDGNELCSRIDGECIGRGDHG